MDEGRSCNYSQLAYGCDSIYGLSKRNFGLSPFMNTSTPLVTICAKREVNNSFYYNAPIDGCPPNTLKCGDEPNYFWCSTHVKCPIFGLGFAQIKETIPDGAEITTIGANQYFWLIRQNPKQLPIVEFRIVEGPGTCMLNHDLAITPGRSDYILMNKYKSDCQRDPRFKVIYSMDEYSYCMQNNALDIPKKQDTYIISPEYTWAFYGRNYMHWRQICRGQRFTDFKDQEDILDDIEYRLFVLKVISIVYFVFVICQTMITYVTFIDCFIQALITEIVLKLVFWILDAFYVISSFSKIRDETLYFDDLLTQDCSDDVTQLTLTNLSNIIEQQLYKIQLTRIIFFAINTFLVLSVILFYICRNLFKRMKSYNFNHRQVQEHEQTQCIQQNQGTLDQGDQLYINADKAKSLDYYQKLDQMPVSQNDRY